MNNLVAMNEYQSFKNLFKNDTNAVKCEIWRKRWYSFNLAGKLIKITFEKLMRIY